MTSTYQNVTFGAGEPIDVNKLNQLQKNISDVYISNSLVNSTIKTVGQVEQRVNTLPIISVGSVDFFVDGKSCVTKTDPFTNQNFTENPYIVASISSNIKKDSALTVRASVRNTSQAEIEVCSNSDKAQNVTISYIAIQMKEIL